LRSDLVSGDGPGNQGTSKNRCLDGGWMDGLSLGYPVSVVRVWILQSLMADWGAKSGLRAGTGSRCGYVFALRLREPGFRLNAGAEPTCLRCRLPGAAYLVPLHLIGVAKSVLLNQCLEVPLPRAERRQVSAANSVGKKCPPTCSNYLVRNQEISANAAQKVPSNCQRAS
jgi:hypothetical protein